MGVTETGGTGVAEIGGRDVAEIGGMGVTRMAPVTPANDATISYGPNMNLTEDARRSTK